MGESAHRISTQGSPQTIDKLLIRTLVPGLPCWRFLQAQWVVGWRGRAWDGSLKLERAAGAGRRRGGRE